MPVLRQAKTSELMAIWDYEGKIGFTGLEPGAEPARSKCTVALSPWKDATVVFAVSI